MTFASGIAAIYGIDRAMRMANRKQYHRHRRLPRHAHRMRIFRRNMHDRTHRNIHIVTIEMHDARPGNDVEDMITRMRMQIKPTSRFDADEIGTNVAGSQCQRAHAGSAGDAAQLLPMMIEHLQPSTLSKMLHIKGPHAQTSAIVRSRHTTR